MLGWGRKKDVPKSPGDGGGSGSSAPTGVISVGKTGGGVVPDAPTVERLFEDVVRDTATTEASRKAMAMLPLSQKWLLVQQHAAQQSSSGGVGGGTTGGSGGGEGGGGGGSPQLTAVSRKDVTPTRPESLSLTSAAAVTNAGGRWLPTQLIRELQDGGYTSVVLLSKLSVEVRTANRDWIESFVAADGLVAIEQATRRNVATPDALRLCLSSLIATLKIKSAVERALALPSLVETLGLAYEGGAPPGQAVGTGGLAGLSGTPLSDALFNRQCVLKVMTVMAHLSSETRLLVHKTVMLHMGPMLADFVLCPEEDGARLERWALKTMLIRLVNEVLNTESLEERMLLRAEQVRAGLLAAEAHVQPTCDRLLALLSAGGTAMAGSPMLTELEAYTASWRVYHDAMDHDHDVITTMSDGVDLYDPESLMATLLTTAASKDMYNDALSTLQHLLLVVTAAQSGEELEGLNSAMADMLLHGVGGTDGRGDAGVLGSEEDGGEEEGGGHELDLASMGAVLRQARQLAAVQEECAALRSRVGELEGLVQSSSGGVATLAAAHAVQLDAITTQLRQQESAALSATAALREAEAASQRAQAEATATQSRLQGQVRELEERVGGLEAQVTELRATNDALRAAAAAVVVTAPAPAPASVPSALVAAGDEQGDLAPAAAVPPSLPTPLGPRPARPEGYVAARPPRPPQMPVGTTPVTPTGMGAAEGPGALPALAMPRPPRPGGGPGAPRPPGGPGGAPGPGTPPGRPAMPRPPEPPGSTTTCNGPPRPPRPPAPGAGPTPARPAGGPTPARPAGGPRPAGGVTASATVPESASAPPVPAKPKKKPAVVAGVKMKGLFWTRLPDAVVDNTVFKDLDDAAVPLDTAELESLFCAAPAGGSGSKGGVASSSGGGGGSEADNRPRGPIYLFDAKREYNAGIVLARLKLSGHDVRKAALAGDTGLLDADRLAMLQQIAPEGTDLSTVASYDGDRSLLGPLEQFYIAISTVPRYSQRLQVMSTRLRFSDVVAECQAKVAQLRSATAAVRDSSALRSLLQHVLAVGNFLNGDTARGGAYGFKFDTVKKLSALRSGDNKTSMLDYLAKLAARTTNHPMAALATELAPASAARNESLEQVKTDVSACAANLNQSAKVVADLAKQEGEAGDVFAAIMQPFFDAQATVVQRLQAETQEVAAAFTNLVASLSDDSTDTLPFFTMLHDLSVEFKRSMDAEAARLARAAKEKKAAGDATKPVALSISTTATGAPAADVKPTLSSASSLENVFEDVYGAIQSGSAVSGRDRTASGHVPSTSGGTAGASSTGSAGSDADPAFAGIHVAPALLAALAQDAAASGTLRRVTMVRRRGGTGITGLGSPSSGGAGTGTLRRGPGLGPGVASPGALPALPRVPRPPTRFAGTIRLPRVAEHMGVGGGGTNATGGGALT